ncbi:MAG: LysR family transcriptional regulator [Alicyclobacillus shizuokensis]|nr:LysR family transcriptional regulator [Alicyclobacillus shizuokensis]
MDFEELQSFMVVARKKSISKAARILHVTQPTLSMRLQRLEYRLGVKLLERKWDGVHLTKHGQFFLWYSVKVLQNMEEAATLIRRQESSELTRPFNAMTRSNGLKIGIDKTLCPALVHTIIRGIHKLNSDIDYTFITEYSDLMLDLIEHQELQICICFSNELVPGIEALPLLDDEMALIYPKHGYVQIREDLSNVAELRDRPFVLLSGSPLINFREVGGQAFLNMYGVVPSRYHIVDNIQVLLDIVAQGAGYSFVMVSQLFHLLEQQLPFHMIRLGRQYPTVMLRLVYVKDDSGAFPVEQIAMQLHARLAAEMSVMSARFPGR